MSADKVRRVTVAELDLDTLDNETVRSLVLASNRAYGKHNMPEQWQGVFDELSAIFDLKITVRTANYTTNHRFIYLKCQLHVGKSHDTGDPHHET